jgi:hypothetical protein
MYQDKEKDNFVKLKQFVQKVLAQNPKGLDINSMAAQFTRTPLYIKVYKENPDFQKVFLKTITGLKNEGKIVFDGNLYQIEK